jgi:tRNA A-37 threonylcarbamoyl transferase component Bud32
MGIVYLALAHGPAGFQKLKVIKRLRADLVADPKALEMFLDEARLAARLHHPNIVQTNEVGFDGKHYFLEMEYLEGQSLDALVRHAHLSDAGGVPIVTSAWILTQILAGLHYAHELRDLDGTKLDIVHRDVSPHNVMVTYEGEVKLLDFGIAKAASSRAETQTGVVKGKITYMAPEQATRRPVDRRADVFAVGVMLWQAITGERVWGDANDFEVFVKLQAPQPIAPARTKNPDAPEELDRIAALALALDPADRYATAAEMQADLEAWLAGKTGGGVRAAAVLMERLFTAQRVAVRAEIEGQIKGTTHGVHTVDVPVLREVSTAPATTAEGTETASGAGNAEVGRTGGTRLRQKTEIRGLRALALVAIGVALIASVAAVMGVRGKRAGVVAGALEDAAPKAAACATNAECTQTNGRASVCNHQSGKCVALEEAGCKILAESGDVENDKTIWIGAMFPLTGPRAETWGTENMRAVDLGRRDFVQIVGGVSRPDGTHPLGIAACDDAPGGEGAARHLAALGVPSVIGFGSSQEVIELAQRVFLPAHIMMIPSFNNSPLITKVSHPSGDPRLIFRVCASSAQQFIPLALFVEQELEPRLRTSHDLRAGEMLRVALARPIGTMGLGFEDAAVASLRFNGKSALENGRDYADVSIPDPSKPVPPGAYEDAISTLLEVQPHIIIYVGEEELTDAFLKPIEARWPPRARTRPYYLSVNALEGSPHLLSWLGTRADLRRRFFQSAPPAANHANVRFASRYNDTYAEKVTADLSPASPYDAFYLSAYALTAADEVSGAGLARAVGRLIGPGSRIEVGPSNIFDAVNSLQHGQNINLEGAASPLDFDLTTGESSVDYAIECVVGPARPGGNAQVVHSGLIFSTQSRNASGVFRCSRTP